MSDIIQLLPDTVANQIAAGEVIQRPASIVKELVENAVDAGAKNIHVVIVDAGRTSVQVIDDGCGMSETDARLSFERHATSKIRRAADLFALHTMGFRGEALPSIAAVAQVRLKTRRPEDELGTQLTIEGSDFKGQEPCACPVGSNFVVDNLFYNVPARRKFLKANSTELNNIVAVFERIVLVNPQIAFTLHNNGTEMFNLKACNLRQRIVEVFGKKINQALLPVSVDTTLCKISGFVGKPESARKKGAHQFFFANQRFMRHPYFNKAVMSAYTRLVPEGEQVPYFLYFEVNPADIDVNIHPTKTEIKFENEQAIRQILSATVKDAIGMFNDVPSIDFDTQDRPDIPVFNPSASIAMPKVSFNPQYNPFNETPSGSHHHAAASQWEQLYEGLHKSSATGSEALASLPFDEEPALEAATTAGPTDRLVEEKSPAHYQYKGRFVMTAVKSGLLIIDQHRAHLRILYERFMSQARNRKGVQQKVLFPEVLQLSASDNIMLQKLLPEMTALGFELTSLGGNAYSINATPADLESLNATTLIQEMLTSASEGGTLDLDGIHHALAIGMARHAAIGYGEVLNNDEMEALVNDLFACPNFNYTPDGKRILAILPQSEIEHLLDA